MIAEPIERFTVATNEQTRCTVLTFVDRDRVAVVAFGAEDDVAGVLGVLVPFFNEEAR